MTLRQFLDQLLASDPACWDYEVRTESGERIYDVISNHPDCHHERAIWLCSDTMAPNLELISCSTDPSIAS